MPKLTTRLLALSLSVAFAVGCSHPLRVKNLEEYSRPIELGSNYPGKPTIGIMPFDGTRDETPYWNAIVERLARDPGIGEVRTNYIAQQATQPGAFKPNLIVDVEPSVTYRSSGWNFLISFPGFLIFTPAWNGYIYRADVVTGFTIYDQEGRAVDQFEVPMTYDIRHAEFDRTVWDEGMGWIVFVGAPLLSGIYNANVFDRDLIPEFVARIQSNYAEYSLVNAQDRIQAVAAAVAPPEAPETSPEEEAAEAVAPPQDPETSPEEEAPAPVSSRPVEP